MDCGISLGNGGKNERKNVKAKLQVIDWQIRGWKEGINIGLMNANFE
jgi:hypothetical protein